MPYSSRACFITPSLFQLHNVQHHTPAAPFLSIADNIAAVYQKRKAKKHLANHYKLAGIKQKLNSIKVRKSPSDSIAIIIASVIDAN